MTGSLANRPVVAVLVTPKEAEALCRHEPPYDYIKYAEAAKCRDILLYCFSTEDMDLEISTVQGWVMDTAGDWVYQDAPWPDYIYNMVKGKAGKREKAQAIKSDSRLVWLNEVRSHPKWQTHRILRKRFAWALPETVRGRGSADLERMLDAHRVVLTKPDNGTWGSGICRIWREASGTYTLQPSNDHEQTIGLSVEDAYKRAKEVAGGRNLIVQRALELLKVDGCVSDLRLMMGRNRLGQWEVVQWYLRIGKPGSFVSNWHRGGSYMDVVPGLEAAGVATRKAEELFKQAQLLALEVATDLQAACTGRMAELGLDIAIDTDLRLWFLEANGWPNKGHVDHETDPIPKVYSCIIDYALFLWDSLVHTSHQ